MLFEIETGIIRISDPKNSKYSWNSYCLNSCKKGNWFPYLEKVDKRVDAFCAMHNDKNIINCWNLVEPDLKVTADSGLLGIYDDKYYQDDLMAPDEFNTYKSGYGKWYDMNVNQAQKNEIGIVSFGCVTDCSKRIFSLYIHNTKKEIDGIRIVLG